jgi:hypothetical protein
VRDKNLFLTILEAEHPKLRSLQQWFARSHFLWLAEGQLLPFLSPLWGERDEVGRKRGGRREGGRGRKISAVPSSYEAVSPVGSGPHPQDLVAP